MKKLRIYLPFVLLALTMLIFTGCKGIVPPSPGATEDVRTISGQIKLPLICCDLAGEVPGGIGDCDETEDWGIAANAVVELKSAQKGLCKKILDTTITDKDGKYQFEDVKPGLYIITAYCSATETHKTDNGFLVKDVAQKLEGVGLDAGIPDCTSTALALVIEKINNCYNDWYKCFGKLTNSKIYNLVEKIAKDVKKVDIPAIMAHTDFGEYCDDRYDDLVDLVCQWNCCLPSPGATGGGGGGTTPTYTVTFDKNGGDTDADPTSIGGILSGGNVGALPKPPTREGYTFEGWNTESDGNGTEFKADTPVTGNITVYAMWKQIPKYHVYYNANGGTGSQTDSNTYYAGSSVTVKDKGSMAKTNYTFTGWNTAADGSGTAYAPNATLTMPAADVTLYAQWVEDTKYHVYYNANGGTGSQTDSNTYYAGSSVTVKDKGSMAKTNYTFTGWNTAADGSGTAYAPNATLTMPAADVTLYAQWVEDTKYHVYYNANGGTGSQTDSNTYYAGSSVTVKDKGSMAKTNYTFTGWNTAADGSGTAYAPNATLTMPAADVTLYAQWVEDTKYHVYYNANGGTGSQTDSNTYYAGSSVTVKDKGSMAKTNYTFTGWNTAADGSGTAYAPNATLTMPAADVTLYAQWKKDCIKVTFDPNGKPNYSFDYTNTETALYWYASPSHTINQNPKANPENRDYVKITIKTDRSLTAGEQIVLNFGYQKSTFVYGVPSQIMLEVPTSGTYAGSGKAYTGGAVLNQGEGTITFKDSGDNFFVVFRKLNKDWGSGRYSADTYVELKLTSNNVSLCSGSQESITIYFDPEDAGLN